MRLHPLCRSNDLNLLLIDAARTMSNEAFTLRTRSLRPIARSRANEVPTRGVPAATLVTAEIPSTLELIRAAREAIISTYGPCAATSMPVITNSVRAQVERSAWPLEVKGRILSELALLS